jgi:AcrR family transcriptional regulator
MRKRQPGRPPKTVAGDTKADLKQAALRLFAQRGFAGTSIRAIAAAVGLSDSVLYAHFASKQAIFDAVLAEYGPRGPAEAPAAVNAELAGTDPPGYLRELIGAYLDEWETEDARLLISLLVRDGLLHTPALHSAIAAMRKSTAQLFQDWIGDGRIPAALGPAQDLALTFTGPIGLLRILHLHADACDAERAWARKETLRHVETFARMAFRTT